MTWAGGDDDRAEAAGGIESLVYGYELSEKRGRRVTEEGRRAGKGVVSVSSRETS